MFGRDNSSSYEEYNDSSTDSYISDETIEQLAFHYVTEIDTDFSSDEPPTPERFANKYTIAYKKIKQQINKLKNINFK